MPRALRRRDHRLQVGGHEIGPDGLESNDALEEKQDIGSKRIQHSGQSGLSLLDRFSAEACVDDCESLLRISVLE